MPPRHPDALSNRLRPYLFRIRRNFKLFVMYSIATTLFFLTAYYFFYSGNASDDVDSVMLSGESQKVDWNYAVIIDAGSTGSRVHVYRYKSLPNEPLIDIDFKNEKYEKFKPGLSSFETENDSDLDEKIGTYVVPLLDFARQHVPLKQRKLTPLYMLATAGMRKVGERSESKAKLIMDACYRQMALSEFIVKPNWIRIISGTNEGLWGWITANYLNSQIQKAVRFGSPHAASPKGVLEMGGESLQITFVPPEDALPDIPDDILTTIEIAGVDFPVFTHSYMGIGMEAAQTKFDTYLATHDERSESSCYLKGDQRDRLTGQKVTWNGAGDFDQCYTQLTNLVDGTSCARTTDDVLMCSPDGISVPQFGNSVDFYYIENFYYTAHVLDIDAIRGSKFMGSLKDKGKDFCALEKTTAEQQFPNASPDEITKTCFCAAWLAVMIDRGFDLTDFQRFEVIRDINGVGIDWALGFLVKSSKEIQDSTSNPGLMGMYLLGAGLAIAVVAWLYCGGNGSSVSTRLKVLCNCAKAKQKYSSVSQNEFSP